MVEESTMDNFVNAMILSLIPLLVAIDIAGILPIYISFTTDIDKKEKWKIIIDSLLTALIVGYVFIFLGKLIFKILSITVNDFKIAGGLVLLSLSIMDLITDKKSRRSPSDAMGVVPLGVPLIVGPAVLTTLLILNDSYGHIVTLSALFVSLILVGLVFISSGIITKMIGKGGTRVLSKLTNLLLVAIAIRMIRLGIEGVLK